MRASAPSSSSSSSPPPQDPTRVFFRRRRRRRSKKKKKRNRYKIPKQRGCFLFKVCREKQKKKKRDPPTMCLFSSFFLSRDFFIGRPWNTCFFSLARERERDSKNFFPFFFVEISLSFFLSFFSTVVPTLQVPPSLSHNLYPQQDRKKIDPTHTKEKKKKRNTTTPAATSETHHPIGLTKVEKTKTTTTTKRGDHRDETRERETSFFVSARLPETTTTSFCRERKRERRAKALYKRAVFVAINQFERRKR